MNYTLKFLYALILALFMTSCGFLLGPDSAEKLAYKIEAKSDELKNSDETSLEFDFIPSEWRLRESTSSEGLVRLDFKVQKDMSVIAFNKWTCTTYHNRFVRVPESLEKVKHLGEPFKITLKKSGDQIDVVDLD